MRSTLSQRESTEEQQGRSAVAYRMLESFSFIRKPTSWVCFFVKIEGGFITKKNRAALAVNMHLCNFLACSYTKLAHTSYSWPPPPSLAKESAVQMEQNRTITSFMCKLKTLTHTIQNQSPQISHLCTVHTVVLNLPLPRIPGWCGRRGQA